MGSITFYMWIGTAQDLHCSEPVRDGSTELYLGRGEELENINGRMWTDSYGVRGYSDKFADHRKMQGYLWNFRLGV